MLAGIIEQLRGASRKRQTAAAERLQGTKEELRRVREECATLRADLGRVKEQVASATSEARRSGSALKEAQDETKAARAAAISAIERANDVSARLRRGGFEGVSGAGGSSQGTRGLSLEDVTAKLAEYSLGHSLPWGEQEQEQEQEQGQGQ